MAKTSEQPSDTTFENVRHSLAHLLAAAVMELWPDTKRAIGPAIDDGFYFDFDFSAYSGDAESRGMNADKRGISEKDLPRIEEKMREILPTWDTFTKHLLTATEAKKEYPNNPYKNELIGEFSKGGKKVSFYKSGEYWDLCRGGHVESTREIKPDAFKLDRIAGAYWRGDEKNKMLTRIYGLAFETKQKLENFLKMREEAEKRDHRKLGQQLDLFAFSDLVGKGLPLFTPRGTILREEINKLSQELREARGFQKVWTPHITKKELYETSGHWTKFGNELFLVKSQETKDELVMKPMNCPHHQQIYASKPRSYRDLPIKYLETTTIYRDEKAGELLGLSRVRSITQDDSHIFCTDEQLDHVYREVLDIVKQFYAAIAMPLRIRLSFSDPKTPEKYLGEKTLWKKAEAILRETAGRAGLDSYEAPGEAAFYGPKIDFMATDSIGREWQVATAQLDFVQPARFKITYTDTDGSEKTPIMVHFAIAGSLERFLAVYIEHTAGAFPLWLAPVQGTILPVSEKFAAYGTKVLATLKNAGIRAELSDANETLGKRIREAEMQKIPYVLVVGEKEKAAGNVNVRHYRRGQDGEIEIQKLIQKVTSEVENKIL